jgi:hypothetical protein
MVADALMPVLTVDQACRPLREYRERTSGQGLVERLSPIDAYLFALLLEFLRGPIVLTDLCGLPSEVSALALSHHHVNRVVTWMEAGDSPAALASRQAVEQIDPGCRRWETCSDLDIALRSGAATPSLPQCLQLVVIGAWSTADGRRAAELARDALASHPQAILIIVGLGRFGECQTLASLALAYQPASTYRITLARELQGIGPGCSLGLIYSRSSDHARSALHRIEDLFITNYDYLDLLAEVSELRALRLAGLTAERPDPDWNQEPGQSRIGTILGDTARRIVRFGRAHRRWIVPPDSHRERLARTILRRSSQQ